MIVFSQTDEFLAQITFKNFVLDHTIFGFALLLFHVHFVYFLLTAIDTTNVLVFAGLIGMHLVLLIKTVNFTEILPRTSSTQSTKSDSTDFCEPIS
jgi:hypothetical protein